MSDKERVEKIIKSSGMSAKRFSEHIGLKTPQVLYDIIKGRNGISKELAEKIVAKCLDYNQAWIITGKGEMLRQPPMMQHPIAEEAKKQVIEEQEKEIKDLKQEVESLKHQLAQLIEANLLLTKNQLATPSAARRVAR